MEQVLEFLLNLLIIVFLWLALVSFIVGFNYAAERRHKADQTDRHGDGTGAQK